MIRSILFWALALIITLAAVVYQRATGPTKSIRGTVSVAGTDLKYELQRSHEGKDDHEVRFNPGGVPVRGRVEWKRFKTRDAWTTVPLALTDGVLIARLPVQPTAGKLIYRVHLDHDGQTLPLHQDPVVIRFHDYVPRYILFPHILAMFAALLLSTRTGLEFFSKTPRVKKRAWWTLGLLGVGGLILGPIVQKLAFGAYWTGWPFGTDFTDNKTLVMFLGWIVALVAAYRVKKPGPWALGAAVLTLVAYAVPHSVLGSELDYETGKMRNVGQSVPVPEAWKTAYYVERP